MLGNSEKLFRTKEVNGKDYQISVLPALKAIGMARKLSKVLLPILGGTIDGMRDEGLTATSSTFSDIAMTLVEQLDGLDLENTIKQLCKGLTCNGKEVRDLDSHFQGELGELVGVLEFALRENFSSFFTGNDLSARLKEMLEGVTGGISTE